MKTEKLASTETYCHYSGLPSPLAYMDMNDNAPIDDKELTASDIDRIIEMAWEDRTPFDAIKAQFGLAEEDVKKLMKKTLKFSSYKRWRARVENCKTKHLKTRSSEINRFKCDRQRSISVNRISKQR